ncbi:MAG: hypothetical protein IPK19_10745 [Chloroflexi bacterium]|nr:hypothetical protein [Chloroflexota bacterium]
MSDEALELADRHAIEEKRLRYVINIPPEYHAEIVRQIIDFNLTSKQVKDLCEGGHSDDGDDTAEPLSATALKMAKVSQKVNATSPQELARALIRQEGDPISPVRACTPYAN